VRGHLGAPASKRLGVNSGSGGGGKSCRLPGPERVCFLPEPVS